MKCDEIKERLSEYVDDVLETEARAVVDEHLSSCKDCQQELASLKALVSELGSLESVEPPKDFLDQLNKRLRDRSWFSKVLYTLFVPMRLKIPLEFAGAVAVAILVFSVLHIQKDQIKPAEAPISLKQEKTVHEVPKQDTLAGAPLRLQEEVGVSKEKAIKSRLTYKWQEEPPTGRETIELALIIKGELRPEATAPGAAMEAAPAPEEKMRRYLAKREAAPSAEPERDEESAAFIPKLTRLIELVGGEVVSIAYEKEGRRPESICAEIPAEQLHTFYDKMKVLGDLKSPPRAVTGKEEGVLLVRIRLLRKK